ncbi:MAG TPA: hypothetical protein VN132_03640, partial [Bdellovibrio sp.]|nr:hypothetical protein [Bdellovibrio sp.]
MLEQRMTAEKAQQKRLIYLKTVYAIAIGLSLFYIIKFNFIYHVSEYNPELLTLWLGLGVLCPLCLYGLKNYFYAALSACFLSTALLDYFL